MKKYLKTIMVVLGIGLLCILVYNVIAKMRYKTEIATILQTIPEFNFKTLDNNDFSQNNIDPDKATVFIYFNTGCDFCQHEAQSVQQNLEKFTNTQFIFVSDEDVSKLNEFIIQHRLTKYDHITFLSDPEDTFTTRFDATSVPYLLIYDKDQKLIKRHKGQLSINALLEILSLDS